MKVVFTLSGTGNPYLQLLTNALEAVGVEIDSTQPGRFFLWRYVFRHGRPDIFHLQWHHNFFIATQLPHSLLRSIQFFMQVLTLKLLGTRFVWTIHNIVNHERRQTAWELQMCRLLARLVDGLIVHCPAAIPVVTTAYQIKPERLHVVPLGHYAACYPPALDRKEARQLLDLPADETRLFLFFGQVRQYKGLEHLISAFTNLQSEQVRLIITGKPYPLDLGRTLSAQADQDPRIIINFDFIPEDRLIAYLSACDLVVLPYRDLLTSSAAIMAASYSRPILIPELGCMNEFPPETAIKYNPDLPKGLQMALETGLSAPLQEMGVAAKGYADQFPWSLVASRAIRVYRSILKEQPTPQSALVDADFE